jgi:glutathione peroxidase
MTLRQRILKLVYPFWMWWNRKKMPVTQPANAKKPAVPFYSLQARLNNGSIFHFSALKGKKVLIVNTASNCGFTRQYKDLETLNERFENSLVVLGFPSNDFKQQEKGTDEEIAAFCSINFGVKFPLVKKSVVKKSPGQHPVFEWLTQASLNGWNNKAPSWNFSKFIINEQGELTDYFGPSVSPLSREFLNALQR